jgi:hypothetical protein
LRSLEISEKRRIAVQGRDLFLMIIPAPIGHLIRHEKPNPH